MRCAWVEHGRAATAQPVRGCPREYSAARSQTTLSRTEQGRRRLTGRRDLRFARALAISVAVRWPYDVPGAAGFREAFAVL